MIRQKRSGPTLAETGTTEPTPPTTTETELTAWIDFNLTRDAAPIPFTGEYVLDKDEDVFDYPRRDRPRTRAEKAVLRDALAQLIQISIERAEAGPSVESWAASFDAALEDDQTYNDEPEFQPNGSDTNSTLALPINAVRKVEPNTLDATAHRPKPRLGLARFLMRLRS